jgi:hypothetical protein
MIPVGVGVYVGVYVGVGVTKSLPELFDNPEITLPVEVVPPGAIDEPVTSSTNCPFTYDAPSNGVRRFAKSS